MAIDNEGILLQSTKGRCANYNPDKTKPIGVKSRDVAGFMLYDCFNYNPPEEGKKMIGVCGDSYCLMYKEKKRI